MNDQATIADRLISLVPDRILERYSFLWPIPVGLAGGTVLAAIVFCVLQLFGAR